MVNPEPAQAESTGSRSVAQGHARGPALISAHATGCVDVVLSVDKRPPRSHLGLAMPPTFFQGAFLASADDPSPGGPAPPGPVAGDDSPVGPDGSSNLAGWAAIGPVVSQVKADEWRFVLRAVNIASWIYATPDGLLYVMVPVSHGARAARELGEYELEQRERREDRTVRDTPLHPPSWWAAVVVALLLGFFLITGPLQARSFWFHYGIADSGQILAGALEQTVTALTLHSDAAHVVGNAVVGGVFLSAVHRRYGAGLGTFVVVTAGALGNLMNAASYGTDHRSLGASTAVMAALGVLTAAQFIRNRRERPRLKAIVAWAPLAGGLALLGTFGAAPQSDLRAHGFGFLAGVASGALVALAFRNRTTPLPLWTRIGFGLVTVGMVAGAWSAALLLPAS